MTTYALDTNVIIDILRNNEAVKRNMILADEKGAILAIPSIVYYEVLRGFEWEKATKRFNEFMEICKSFDMLYFDRYNKRVLNASAMIYANLRKQGALIEDNDIYIAATAMVNDAILVTDNIKHFSRIEGLGLVNWKE